MSNAELGTLLFAMVCLLAWMITIVTAGKRIEEEKKTAKEYKELYQKAYRKLNPHKLINCQLEKENQDLKAQLAAYEEIALNSEDELIDTVGAMEDVAIAAEEKAVNEVSIDNIATELCKRKDVERFSIDVRGKNYSICGGGR